MRQTRRAQHERQRQGDEVERILTVLQTRVEDGFPDSFGGIVHGGGQQGREIEAVEREHPDGHGEGTGDEQNRLDDLHPGGALHSADEDVDDHQRADDGDDQ